MGGKNHQPCRVYLKNSTLLSKHLSLARAKLDLGNVALEEIILAELDGSHGVVDDFLTYLAESKAALEQAQDSALRLRRQMEENNFSDLPTLKSVDLDAIGLELAGKGCLNHSAWQEIATTMRRAGFYSVLAHFQEGILLLGQKTQMLLEKVEDLTPVAAQGELHAVLEENRPGNIKSAFAEVYAAWGELEQLFLASSLLSTELWYAFNNHGSLVARATQSRAA